MILRIEVRLKVFVLYRLSVVSARCQLGTKRGSRMRNAFLSIQLSGCDIQFAGCFRELQWRVKSCCRNERRVSNCECIGSISAPLHISIE